MPLPAPTEEMEGRLWAALRREAQRPREPLPNLLQSLPPWELLRGEERVAWGRFLAVAAATMLPALAAALAMEDAGLSALVESPAGPA